MRSTFETKTKKAFNAIIVTINNAMRRTRISLRHIYGKRYDMTEGNKKLVSSSDCRFLIWSLPSIMTCPNRTALCEDSCYALKAEKVYGDVLTSRLAKLNASESDDFISVMVENIHNICSKKSYSTAKKVVIRIHESGDFYSRKYWLKWVDIMNQCADIENLCFVAYTKSVFFIEKNEIPKNLSLLGSVWADTDIRTLARIAHLGIPYYTADTAENVEKMVASGEYQLCTCADCGHCENPCHEKHEKNTVVVIH